jgi:hypothetical protein
MKTFGAVLMLSFDLLGFALILLLMMQRGWIHL